ncbi:hypothetical protein CE91St56_14100 [Lachnospiraceae bacterium]|nr:hypothetical protein CE91St56_14100 [Lachnospiraceae bacterium]GKH40352.1 hypothetical protein CE91St57_13260 [Lachnospiraceae bacterium]
MVLIYTTNPIKKGIPAKGCESYNEIKKELREKEDICDDIQRKSPGGDGAPEAGSDTGSV